MEDNRPVTTREIKAVVFNMKEERVLAKKIQTLDLEEHYAMKLIGLGNRQVKISHRRMKNKVSKIRSHLSAEEIADLRMAEMEGTFIPRSLTPVSGTLKLPPKPYNGTHVRSYSARAPSIANQQSTHVPGRNQTLSAHLLESGTYQGADRTQEDLSTDAPVPPESQALAGPSAEPQSARVPSVELRSVHMNPLQSLNVVSMPNPSLPQESVDATKETSEKQKSTHPKPEVQDENVSQQTELKVPSTRALEDKFSRSQSARVHTNKRDTDISNILTTSKTNPRSSETAASKKIKLTDCTDSMKKQVNGKYNGGILKPNQVNANNSSADKINMNNSSSNGLPASNGYGSVSLAKENRPSTSAGNPLSGGLPCISRPKTAPGSNNFSYSSHEITTRKSAPQNSVLSTIATQHSLVSGAGRPGLDRRCSLGSVTSIGSNIAREKAAERRQDLLEEEQYTKAELENKRQDFLDRIALWIKENPAVTIKPKPKEPEANSKRPFGHVAFRSRHRALTAEEIQQQTDAAWKELKKCRYLRIAQEEMDLSGVNTLVKDQLALYGTFKIKNQTKRKASMAQFNKGLNNSVESETIVELNT